MKKLLIALILHVMTNFTHASDLPREFEFDGGKFEFRENFIYENSQLFVYTNNEKQWVSRFSILIENEKIAPGTWIHALKTKVRKNGGTVTGEKIPESTPDAGMLVFMQDSETSIWKVENLKNGKLIAYEITVDWGNYKHGIEWLQKNQQELSVKMLNFKFPKPKI